MPKFRKKPIVIEAFQWFESMGEVGGVQHHHLQRDTLIYKSDGFYIHTLEGWMRVGDGDWVITGVNGEIYPCKPDIFDKTYEPVEDKSVVGCWDCGKPYPFGLDVTLPIDQWQEVSGDAQMLCVSCILIRAAQLPGVTAARLALDTPEAFNTGIASETTEWEPGRWIRRVKKYEPVEESEQ